MFPVGGHIVQIAAGYIIVVLFSEQNLFKSWRVRHRMVFSKTFPKQVAGSSYPSWEEIILTSEEETEVERRCRQEHFQILDECLQEAKILAIKHAINTEENQTLLAIALFEKRSSHEIFWKENKAKEKFDRLFKH